jgi:hypothetical protein
VAVITAMVILPRDTAIPADAVTNTWHFNTNDTETDFTVATNIKTRLQGFYDTAHGTNAVSSYLSKALDPANGRLKLYKQSDAPPRVPFSDVSFALVGVGTGDPMVSEAAICMSFHAAYTSGVNRARRRGRIFLGPLAVNTIAFLNNEPVVDATCRTDITASAEWLIAQDTAALKWAVFSQADNTGHAPIVGGWVDNAYDTQRRRGRAATARTNILTG